MLDNLISVIIPIYNAEKYIEETLNSLVSQSYTNWECLLIDDGSNDCSKFRVERFCIEDQRFKYFYQNNAGPSAARNYGISLSVGDFIQFLDADDVLLPERFFVLMKLYEDLDEKAILYTDLYLGQHDNILNTVKMNRPASIGSNIHFLDMYNGFANNFLIIPSCCLFRKLSLKNVLWDEKICFSEDFDFYLKVLYQGFYLKFVSESLVIYRNTPFSLSKNERMTILSNYLILNDWAVKVGYFRYSIRTAEFLNRSIYSFLFKRSERIYFPFIPKSNQSILFVFSYFMIYPFMIIFFIDMIIGIIWNKILNKE